MRIVALAASIFVLEGCGESVRATPTPDPVAIARAEAIRQGIELKDERPPEVLDDGATWTVVLDPPPRGWKGGGIEVSVDKQSRRVVELVRGK